MSDKGVKEAIGDTRFEALLLASASIVWWTDASGEFVEEQPYWQAYTGQTWEEYRGTGWVAGLHPDDKDAIIADWTAAVETGGPYITRGRIWSVSHNAYRAFQTRGIAIRDDHGQIYEWLGALTDVQDTLDLQAAQADLAQSMSALRIAEARATAAAHELQALYDAAPVGLAVLDKDGRYLRLNRTLAELNRRPMEEHIGRSVADLLPQYAGPFVEAFEQVVNRKEVVRLSLSGSVGPGAPEGFWEDTLFPLDMQDGPGIGAIVEDVTERARRERDLEDREAHLRLALESADQGSWSVDLESGEAVWSRRHAELQGYDPDGGPLSMADWEARLHPEDRQRVMAAIEKAREERGLFKEDHRVQIPGGQNRWLSLYGRFSYDREGKATKFSGVSRDVTLERLEQDRLSFLMREVNHRSKNMLTLVQAIARNTMQVPRDMFNRFEDRLQAISRSQDVLVEGNWKTVGIMRLIEAHLGHLGEHFERGRIELRGPLLTITGTSAQALGMALHELATNAVKHGALAPYTDQGHVLIEWFLRDLDGIPAFYMRWIESGGPKPATGHKGFGTTVVTSLTSAYLNGQAELVFREAGVEWSVVTEAKNVLAPRE